ncbi:pilus assembly protein [bacterium]|nr:pilus assembly protein [bacterium]
MRILRKPFDRSSSRRGAAVLEMALVLPIFFMVVLGIVEFGRAMMVGQMVTNAAREATRLAIVDGSTNSSVEDWIQEFLQSAIGVDAADVTVDINVTAAPGNDDPGNEVGNAQSRDLITVAVSVPFDKVSYLPGNYLNGKQLAAQSAMRHE